MVEGRSCGPRLTGSIELFRAAASKIRRAMMIANLRSSATKDN